MSKKDALTITAFFVPWFGGIVSTWIEISLAGVLAVIALTWFSFAISNWAWRKANV